MRFLAFLCFWLSLLVSARPVSAAELSLIFFDVGQGDAALLISPTGKRILIDGGPPEGTDALLQGLANWGVDRLDLVLLSHPHLDHLGGLRKVIESMPVALYMDADYASTSPAYVALRKTLLARGVAVKAATMGRIIDIGDGAILRFLSPPQPWLSHTRSDVNANSVLVRLTWRGRTALFAGDAEPETEKWLLGHYRSELGQLQAEVLKVAHHGGKFSSTEPFLAAVMPRWAVISVATVNDYGHPTAEALGRLFRIHAEVLRTDQQGHGGAILLRSRDGQAWRAENVRGKYQTANISPSQAAVPPDRPATSAVAADSPSVPAFVGSRSSNLFHRDTCAAARRIRADNLQTWKNRAEAIASGRVPAEDCHP